MPAPIVLAPIVLAPIVLALIVLALGVGCDARDERPAPPGEVTGGEVTGDQVTGEVAGGEVAGGEVTGTRPGDDGCVSSAPEAWLEGVGSRGSIALAMRGERGLVVFATETELRARAIARDGRAIGEAARAPAPGTRGLLALEPLGDGYLLLARASCAASAHCLVARALSGSGAPIGAPIASPLPSPIRTFRRASSGSVFVAWSSAGGHRALERYALGEDGALEHARMALGDAPASAEAPVEILGLAADGDRWAALWRRGPTEAITSQVVLSTRDAHRPIAALHDALAVDAIALEDGALEGGALSLITTFEFARPHYLRVALASGEPTDARELGADAPIPAPLVDRDRAELDADARGLWLRRRSPAGYPIGARVEVAGGGIGSAALTRAGDALLVAWLAGGAVRARTIRCR